MFRTHFSNFLFNKRPSIEASCRERPDVTDTATATAIDSAAGADSDTGTDSGADSSASTGSGSATGADATTSTGSGSGSVTADAETGFTEGADSGTAADTPADSPKASGIAAGSGRESRTGSASKSSRSILISDTGATSATDCCAATDAEAEESPSSKFANRIASYNFLSLSKTKSRSMPGTSCEPAQPSTSSIKRASSSCILFTSITKSVYQSQRYEKYRMRETVCPQIAKNSPMQLDDYFPNRKNYVYLCFGCKTERKTFERTPHPLCCIYPH